MIALPPFVAPAPEMNELINNWHLRVVRELERWVNEVMAPALAERGGDD